MDNYYEKLENEAEAGKPAAMYELAQAYGSGVIPDYRDQLYLYWLKRFMTSDIVERIVSYYDDDSGSKVDEYSAELVPMIIEAGLDLGLYYRNSSEIKELKFAAECVYAAFVSSRYDFIELNDGEIDMMSLLYELTMRSGIGEE